MTKPKSDEASQSQLSKFKEAAKQVETDDSEERFDTALRRVAKTPAKPEGVSRHAK